jgi:hypothetical protein
MPSHKSDPRAGRSARAENVTRGPGRRNDSTGPVRHDRRFRADFVLTESEVETAIATADATQLARALDPYYFEHTDAEVTVRCPVCAVKAASAVSRWRWRCADCDAHGSWIGLRQAVALDVEACVRLARIVHGERVMRPAGEVRA